MPDPTPARAESRRERAARAATDVIEARADAQGWVSWGPWNTDDTWKFEAIIAAFTDAMDQYAASEASLVLDALAAQVRQWDDTFREAGEDPVRQRNPNGEPAIFSRGFRKACADVLAAIDRARGREGTDR